MEISNFQVEMIVVELGLVFQCSMVLKVSALFTMTFSLEKNLHNCIRLLAALRKLSVTLEAATQF